MMKPRQWFDTAIHGTFGIFFFALPLVLTPVNYELFEFNKMILVYTTTTIIGLFWLAKMIINQEIKVAQTPLDIPIILYLISQIAATITSIDPHISVWGYYGRFNGGLLSTFCYIILYYALATHFSARDIVRLVKTIFASSIVVCMYAILQRLGIDKHLWVQDVQHRVFATLGQPNWLAAYIAVLIFPAMAMGVTTIKDKEAQAKTKNWIFFFMFCVLCSMFYSVLLFTGSRSGFLAFWAINALWWLGLFIVSWRTMKQMFFFFLIFNFSFFILTFSFSSPYPQLNEISKRLFQQPQTTVTDEASPSASPNVTYSESVITDSGDIRKLVWQGAIDAFIERPYTGWGVETFAWVYYKFKPVAHNNTSEWDFLYNKAHNEYLNLAATSGGLGLGSYLTVIGVFLIWVVWRNAKFHRNLLTIALTCGWLTLLITNFFGFSVVMTNTLFWLIPAFVIVLTRENNRPTYRITMQGSARINSTSLILVAGIALFSMYTITSIWLADYYYAKGNSSSDAGKYATAYKELTMAVTLRGTEPMYRSELASVEALAAIQYAADNQATATATFAKDAIAQSDIAIKISPQNLNSWKARTRMFYALSQIDEVYLNDTLKSIAIASSLAPTDAKISYNLGLIYDAIGDRDEAIKTLTHTMELKPNYRDAAYALALFYEDNKDTANAQRWFHYILDKINPNDDEVKKKIK